MTGQTTPPAAGIGEGRNDQVGAGSFPILPRGTDIAADDAAAFRECFAILVRGKSVRRHLYFNLPAAERQVRRARARGDVATMVLVRLEPVDGAS